MCPAVLCGIRSCAMEGSESGRTIIMRRNLPAQQAVVVLDDALLPVRQAEGAVLTRTIPAIHGHVLCP